MLSFIVYLFNIKILLVDFYFNLNRYVDFNWPERNVFRNDESEIELCQGLGIYVRNFDKFV